MSGGIATSTERDFSVTRTNEEKLERLAVKGHGERTGRHGLVERGGGR